MSRKVSPFAHLLKVDSVTTAYWNSLWLRTVFLAGDELEVAEALHSGKASYAELARNADYLPLLEILKDNHFFEAASDEKKIQEVRRVLTDQPVGILYLIVTEGCNLACSYPCYLKEMVSRERAMKEIMTVEIARSSIDLFAETVKANGVEDPEIIFYGGEPLLNWEVVEWSLTYASRLIPSSRFTMNTNGSFVTKRIAKVLKQFDVSVALSIDGKSHDTYRHNLSGKGNLSDTLRAHEILREQGVSIGISYTITDANVGSLIPDFTWLVDEVGAESVDYNILMASKEPKEEYAKKAVSALLKCFDVARERGILIDRVMRRVESFSKGELSLTDCGGCGQQIVCAPNGSVGICQAFLNDGENFFPMHDVADPEKHPLWLSWKQRSPFNIPECLECPALGICGGGCFYTPYVQKGDVMALDTIHCELALQTLEFLVKQLHSELD